VLIGVVGFFRHLAREVEMLDRRFSGSFVMYIAAFGVAGLSPFILLPFLTHNLSSTEFGIAALFITMCQLVANFASFGTHGYVSVQYFKPPKRQWGSSVSAALLLIVAVHAGLLLAFFVAGGWIAQTLSVPSYILVLVIFSSLLICSNFIYLAIYQASERPQFYLLSRSIQAALEVGLCFAALSFFAPSAGARVYTYPVAVGAAVVLGLVYCWVNGVFSTQGLKESVRGAIRFGAPTVPHVAAGTLVSFLDRIIIASVMGPSSLGIYMAATQLGLVMLLIIEPFNKAYAPWLFSRLSSGDEKAHAAIVRFTYLFFLALAAVGILAAAAASMFYDLIVGAEFSQGRILVPFIIAGYVAQGMYYTVVNYLFYAEKTHVLSAVSVTMAAVGTGVTYTMVTFFGLMGAAASLVINNSILFLLVWFFAAREVRLPWLVRLRAAP
jgi:O-antigen/teichoic acid export membrane protein